MFLAVIIVKEYAINTCKKASVSFFNKKHKNPSFLTANIHYLISFYILFAIMRYYLAFFFLRKGQSYIIIWYQLRYL